MRLSFRFSPAGIGASLLFAGLTLVKAQDDHALAPYVVEADAPSPWQGSVGYSGRTLSHEELAQRPGSVFSDRLIGEGGFRLFRRQSALTAHPTTQGASMRVAGPNGASRAQLFLDGVPLNDPFGGWIPWTALNPLQIGRTSLVQPSGIDPWGHNSLGGTLWLERREQDPFWSLEGAWGNALDHRLSHAFLFRTASGQTDIHGSWSSLQSSGYPIVASGQRGSIDEDATLEANAFTFGVVHRFASPWRVEAQLRYNEERRGNGTPQARNAQDAWLGSVTLAKQRAGSQWEGRLTGYAQTRDFSSVFTSVNANRDAERAVLDQFDVPATSVGLSWRSRHWLGEQHEFLLGWDGSFLEGETNEHFRNLGDGFTRRRRAGGERWKTALTGQHTWRARPDLAVKSSLRVDRIWDKHGEEKIWSLESGERLLDQNYDDRDDWHWSGRLALEWEPADGINTHLSAFTGTREPTLNELYRPFRVGNDITLANPALDNERLWGATAGFRWEATDTQSFSIEAFWHRLDDAVANVTLIDEGGQFVPPWGFIPEGGSGRQRRNLDDVRIQGLEARWQWQVTPDYLFRLGYLLTDSEIHESSDQPSLEGKWLAQLPKHQAFASLEYDAGGHFHSRLEARWTGKAFDDDLNRRDLDDFLVLNAFFSWRFTDEVSLFASIENLLNEEIQVSRSGSGLMGLGAPRLAHVGLRLDY